GPMQFGEGVLDTYGVADGSLAFGDVDNDGDQDLAIMGQAGSGSSRVYRLLVLKNVGGSLVYDPNWDLTASFGVGQGKLQLADINNDGYLDLVAFGRNSTRSSLRIFLNTKSSTAPFNGTPIEPENLSGVSYGSLAIADYDNDGDLDMLVQMS